ncbi:hypothetical protein KEM54_005511 [Ascosphaera aggregata]|nr:hypothetical protein KEM54_005511 [Ascosphaera aggregata]
MLSLNSPDEYRDRVYVALYGPSDPLTKATPESFQWAFHVSPKSAPHGSFQTARYQLKKHISRRNDGSQKSRWVPEQEFGLDAGPETLFVEVQIGGIKATRYEFEECLRDVKIRQNDPAFNDRLKLDPGILTRLSAKSSVLSWEVIEQTIVNYYLEQLQQGTKGTPPEPFDLMPFGIAT